MAATAARAWSVAVAAPRGGGNGSRVVRGGGGVGGRRWSARDRSAAPSARRRSGCNTRGATRRALRVAGAEAEFDLDALMPPDIDGDLEGLQEEAGAVFDDDGIPLHYGDAAAEAEVIATRVGILDRAGRWKLLRVSGPGAVGVLEAAGAEPADIAALTQLQPGQGAAVTFGGDGTKTKSLAMAHVQARD